MNVDLELWHNVRGSRTAKGRDHRILSDKQHPIGRVNLEGNSQALQHARLRRGALASREFSQIRSREQQLFFSCQW